MKTQTSPKGENHTAETEVRILSKPERKEHVLSNSGVSSRLVQDTANNKDTSFEEEKILTDIQKKYIFGLLTIEGIKDICKEAISLAFQKGAEKTKQEILREIKKSQTICKHNFNFKNTMAGKYREQGMNEFAKELQQSINKMGEEKVGENGKK